MMIDEEIKVSDVRAKILLSAIGLFKQYGFKSVTMDDIARRSGISKKTLYQHFDNKTKIVTDAMVWYKDALCAECDSIQAAAANAVEAFVKIKASFDNVYKEVNPLAIFELQRFYPEGYEQFRKNMERDVASVKSNLDAGIEEGNYRPDINTEILARFHIESSLMIMMPNMMVQDRFDLRLVNREIMEHFMYGIMTTKGEKLYRKYKEQYLK
jgi:AcrR family transcriptional regulator